MRKPNISVIGLGLILFSLVFIKQGSSRTFGNYLGQMMWDSPKVTILENWSEGSMWLGQREILPSGEAKAKGKILIDGDGASDVKVGLLLNDTKITQIVTTDEKGNFTISLPSGTYVYNGAVVIGKKTEGKIGIREREEWKGWYKFRVEKGEKKFIKHIRLVEPIKVIFPKNNEIIANFKGNEENIIFNWQPYKLKNPRFQRIGNYRVRIGYRRYDKKGSSWSGALGCYYTNKPSVSLSELHRQMNLPYLKYLKRKDNPLVGEYTLEIVALGDWGEVISRTKRHKPIHYFLVDKPEEAKNMLMRSAWRRIPSEMEQLEGIKIISPEENEIFAIEDVEKIFFSWEPWPDVETYSLEISSVEEKIKERGKGRFTTTTSSRPIGVFNTTATNVSFSDLLKKTGRKEGKYRLRLIGLNKEGKVIVITPYRERKTYLLVKDKKYSTTYVKSLVKKKDINSLLELLKETEISDVRYAVAKELGEIKNDKAIEPLLNLYTELENKYGKLDRDQLKRLHWYKDKPRVILLLALRDLTGYANIEGIRKAVSLKKEIREKRLRVKRVRINLLSKNSPLHYGKGGAIFPVTCQTVRLHNKPEEKLKKLPELSSPLFGAIKLGNAKDNLITLIIDQKGKEIFLYADSNNDEDLTNDGKPIRVSDKHFYGGLNLLVNYKIKRRTYQAIYRVTLSVDKEKKGYGATYWVTDSSSHKGGGTRIRAMVSSGCSYSGEIELTKLTYFANLQYKACASDSNTDGLFSDNGLYIDLNQDGEYDEDTEHLYQNALFKVNDKIYRLTELKP